MANGKRRLQEADKRPQKIWKPWEATGSDKDEEELPVMKEKQLTATETDHAPLNLPDLPFSALMMMLSTTQLRRLTQVSSSWKKRIQKNILENTARQKDLRDRIEKVMGPGKLPSIEEISDAMWLSK